MSGRVAGRLRCEFDRARGHEESTYDAEVCILWPLATTPSRDSLGSASTSLRRDFQQIYRDKWRYGRQALRREATSKGAAFEDASSRTVDGGDGVGGPSGVVGVSGRRSAERRHHSPAYGSGDVIAVGALGCLGGTQVAGVRAAASGGNVNSGSGGLQARINEFGQNVGPARADKNAYGRGAAVEAGVLTEHPAARRHQPDHHQRAGRGLRPAADRPGHRRARHRSQPARLRPHGPR